MTSTMQQLRYIAPGKIEWQETKRPTVEASSDVIVRPIASSTCDLDQLIIRGRTPFKGPFAIGHECVAEVIETGDTVSDLVRGDTVVVPWHIACGTCINCKAGVPAGCLTTPRNAMYGMPVGGDYGGLFDDYVHVPFGDQMLVKVPEGVNPHHVASFGDNVSVAWEAVEQHIRRKPGARVLVVGGSASLSVFIADVACALGADVHYFDFSARRLEIAKSFGATVYKGMPTPEHGEFDIGVDAGVNPESLRQMLTMLKPEGHCEYVGMSFEDVPFPVFEMYMRGVTFHTGRVNTRVHLPFILDLKKRGCIHPEHAYTATHSYEEVVDAITASAKPLFIRNRIT